MTEFDRKRWNEKFSKRSGPLSEVDSFIRDHLKDFEGHRVLELACGDGRNLFELAGLGCETVGVDISQVGLQRMKESFSKAGFETTVFERDLDEENWNEGLLNFSRVLMICFKPSPALASGLKQVLEPGGRVYYRTFSIKEHEENGFNKIFCVSEQELFNLFPGFEILGAEELYENSHYYIQAVLRKPARKGLFTRL